MNIKYYSILFLLVLILLFSIYYCSPGETFVNNLNNELIQMGCFYLEMNKKYLAFTSNENISHVFVSDRTPDQNPPAGEYPVYYNKKGKDNQLSSTVDINLKNPQKWIFEKGYEDSLIIRTFDEPHFYLACDCDGKIYTTLIKQSSNQYWNVMHVKDDLFALRSKKFKYYLTSLDSQGYLFTNSRGKVYGTKETGMKFWNIIPCEKGTYAVVSKNACSTGCGYGTQTFNIRCQKKCKNVDPLDCVDSPQIKNSGKCYNISGCKPFWKTSSWSNCDTICGNGEMKRTAKCVYKLNNGKIIDAKKEGPYCSDPEPPLTKNCRNISGCKTGWVTGEYGKCNTTCGKGTKSRDVTCRMDLPNNQFKSVSNQSCSKSKKPSSIADCDDYSNCKRFWKTGDWSICSNLCGKGTQKRSVTCNMLVGSNIKTISNSQCPLSKPITEKDCLDTKECDWVADKWSVCDSVCGPGSETRSVFCENILGNKVNTEYCNIHKKPKNKKDCSNHLGCGWKTGDWGKCSKSCGPGKQKRTVVCMNNSTNTEQNSSLCKGKEPTSEKDCIGTDCAWEHGKWKKCNIINNNTTH